MRQSVLEEMKQQMQGTDESQNNADETQNNADETQNNAAESQHIEEVHDDYDEDAESGPAKDKPYYCFYK